MKRNKQVAVMCTTALLAALCYIGFQYLKVDINIAGSKTAIHFGNAFCVLAALLLGGVRGGAAGAIGMGLADLLGGYAASAPKTVIMKLMIGIITGFVAHRHGHIKEHLNDKAYVMKFSFIASAAAMIFNLIFDPIASFFYKNYILGMTYEAAKIIAAWGAVTTLINAATTIVFATAIFTALSSKIKHLAFFKD